MRRLLILLFSLSLLGVLPARAAEPEPVKVVYHIADGKDQAMRALGNIRNHLRAEPGTKITVVALGNGIEFLLTGTQDRAGKPFDAMVADLMAQGVDFRVCRNSLTAHEVAESRVLPKVTIVPAGVAEIARLQAREGYVYLRP
jgi:intracellular sulfur oxidation DsrE/DsrF family protein